MNEKELRNLVQRLLLTEFARAGEAYVPVMSSNRHCHLSQADVERLFGPGYRLTKLKDLVQPGQYACNERVNIVTAKGSLTLRVVGPARKETQVELSLTDCAKLGLNPPVRMSGELQGTPGCTLTNGGNSITVDRGVIVAARHLHLSPEEAGVYGVKDGDAVSLKVEGIRPVILEQVIVRSGPAHVMEAHIDKDEANACGLKDGTLCRVIIPGRTDAPVLRTAPAAPPPAAAPSVNTAPAAEPKTDTMLDLSGKKRLLLTEEDVIHAAEAGIRLIRYGKDAIITPLARDAASGRRIELAQTV